ncbi:alpha/beta fold hydrolase [Erythrobacter crassostreae]|uniref:Alpha/beta hydrolase n=1 Tax=Erythrobacter crassostreae TaxID=2828328 RepID=A0A9X1JKY3_9SPHN|nr:alpha/beta hydrolase [Erythrobacter crassostrea]MBV7259570.1 alpha/beta hydrolase [Erythrobacter crassostrea]
MASNYEDRSWTSEDGLNLHYRDYVGPKGYDGPPVLCLHGLTRNARDFADLADHLCQTRRVIVPEMRGRGMSDYAPSSDTYNPLQYVADLEKLLSEEGIEQFISIGTSMGGLMTMLMAPAKPGRILAFAINDIGPEVNMAGVERIGTYVGQGGSYPTWIHAARSLSEVHSGAFPDFDLDQWLEMAKRTLVVSQNGRISYDYDMAIAEPFKVPGNAAPPDLWPAYDALRDVPMVLLRGELSDLLTPETVAKMVERNPAMKVVTVPRVGHAPTLDEPEARAAIDELLASV